MARSESRPGGSALPGSDVPGRSAGRRPGPGRLRDAGLLGSRDGRLFLTAQALDSLASGVGLVAFPWLVLDATHSAALAGLVWALEVAPYVVFGLPAGLAGDRFPRRRLIACAHLAQAVCAVVVPAWALAGSPPVLVVAACAFLIGSGRAFADAGAFGAVSTLVGRAQFTSGQAVLSAAWATGLLAGPAIGGVLIGSIGAAATLWVQAAAFMVATLLVVAIRTSLSAPTDARTSAGADLVGGIRFLVRDPFLRVLTLTGMAWSIAVAGASALAVPLLRSAIGLGATQAGAVLAFGSLIGIVSPVLVTRLAARHPGYRLFLATLVLSIPATAALGVSYGLVAAALSYGLFSLVNWVEMSVFIGERQRRAPEALQARVGISGRMVITGSLAAGAGLASVLSSMMTLRSVYLLLSAAMLAVSLVAIRVVPRSARRVALDGD